MAIETVIFDCDGVLFSSKEANRAYYSTLAEDFGRPPLDEDEVAFVHTHTVFESVDHIFRDNPGVIEEAHQVRAERGYGPFVKLMIPEPGIYELLNRLLGQVNLAIVTSRSDTMGLVLKTHDMEKYFTQVVTCLDVERPKPDPEGINKVLKSFGTLPNKAVYVGDAPSDGQAAAGAGVHFIGYRDESLGGRAIIHHFDEVDALLGEL